MDSSEGAKSFKNFYISLDQPSDYIFKDGDIVSGKCCLFSPVDEDVGSITIAFNGTVTVRFVVAGNTQRIGNMQNHVQSDYNSKDVLFSYTKLLFRGPYTLRKNVPYQWPFQFQFPSGSSLPQSGTFGKDHYNRAAITYELEACRGRTSQDIAELEKRITPTSQDRNASTQSHTLFEKIGSFKGMIANVPLNVSPPRQILAEPNTATCRINCKLPASSSQPTGSRHHGLSSLLHSHRIFDTECNIVLKLPRNLIHDAPIPIFLRVESGAELAPLSLHMIDLQLKVLTTVISKLGWHRHTDESKVTLFNKSKVDIPLSINSTLDIGKSFNLLFDPSIIPSFIYPRVEVTYSLQAHVALECGEQRVKEDFVVEEVQVMSNRTPNSPLRRDHLCVFASNNWQDGSGPPQYSVIEKPENKDFSNAYLCLSRILTQNFIPHSPYESKTGEPTIMLHGQLQLLDPPPSSSSSSQMTPTLSASQADREDALKSDQSLLDYILSSKCGYEATSMRTGRASLEKFSYSWISPTAPIHSPKRLRRKTFTSLEISTHDVPNPSSEVLPPPYSKVADLFSPIALLNRSLHRITDLDHPDLSDVSDALYVINQFSLELRSRINEIDLKAASIVGAEFEELKQSLMNLGVDVDYTNTKSEGLSKEKENRSMPLAYQKDDAKE